MILSRYDVFRQGKCGALGGIKAPLFEGEYRMASEWPFIEMVVHEEPPRKNVKSNILK